MKTITLKVFRSMINHKNLDEFKDLPVVYSRDDEGNGFGRVLFAPSVMEGVEPENDHEANFEKAICIN